MKPYQPHVGNKKFRNSLDNAIRDVRAARSTRSTASGLSTSSVYTDSMYGTPSAASSLSVPLSTGSQAPLIAANNATTTASGIDQLSSRNASVYGELPEDGASQQKEGPIPGPSSLARTTAGNMGGIKEPYGDPGLESAVIGKLSKDLAAVAVVEDSGSGSSESDEEVSPPIGFTGRLWGNEQWRKCPYDKSHRYIDLKEAGHLSRCRQLYIEKTGKKEDFVVCRYMAGHHVLKSRIKKHELKCKNLYTMFGFLEVFIEKQRRSNLLPLAGKGTRRGSSNVLPQAGKGRGRGSSNLQPLEGEEGAGRGSSNVLPPAGKGRGRGRGSSNLPPLPGRGGGRGRGKI